jgi:hypothetical protein
MTAPEMPSYKSERWLKQMGWEEYAQICVVLKKLIIGCR